MALILRYAFDELNLYRVGLEVMGDNEPAVKLYEKAGFQREALQREAVQRDGQHVDMILMSLLRPEWAGSQQ